MAKKKKEIERIEVIPIGEGVWAVPSSSKSGVTYRVELQPDGSLRCNCPAGWNGKMCKHKRAVMMVEEERKLKEERELSGEQPPLMDDPPSNPAPKLTKNGYALDEVASALQKSIRLGDEEQAIYWALELYETAPNYTWKRVLITAAEDIGLAAPDVVAQVSALAQAWEFCRKMSYYVSPHHLTMAVMLLCRAPKSTEVEDAQTYIMEKKK